MKEAGVTQGALYKNLESRDELVAEAILHVARLRHTARLEWPD